MRKLIIYILSPLVVLIIQGCDAQKHTVQYGEKIFYSEGKKFSFPDLELEYLGKDPPRPYEKHPRYKFEVTDSGGKQLLTWGEDLGDIGRLRFKSNEKDYTLEIVGSMKYGYLGENVLVLWKGEDWNR